MGFDRGNARKLVRSPLVILGALASIFVRRHPQRWVFASPVGVGEGALPLALRAHEAGITVTWLSDRASDRDDARSKGFRAAPKSGFSGWTNTLRAHTVVVTHGLGDANPYGLTRARIVQLWHGIPLKRLHRDAPATFGLPRFPGGRLAAKALQSASERAYRHIDTFVVASRESGSRMVSAFGLRLEQLAVTGDPRDDVLCLGTPEERSRAARYALAEALHSRLTQKLVLFAPTWRDGEIDPVVPSPREWEMLDRVFSENNATLMVRPHPLARGAYAEGIAGRRSIVLLDFDHARDLTPLLGAFDELITDYSSVAYDFALLERPILYFAPDLLRYQASRGFYEEYEVFSGGQALTSWSDVVAAWKDLQEPYSRARAIAHAQQVTQRVHAFRDGRNTERLWERLMASRNL